MRVLLLFVMSSAALAQTANVVKYHATINDVKYVRAGDARRAREIGGHHRDEYPRRVRQRLKKPGDTQSMVGDNPLTGPFYVDGAKPGDTLAVKILDLQVDGNQGVGAFAPGFGALNETSYTPCCIRRCRRRSGFIPSIRRATRRRSRRSIRTFR
jgi:acetamidase/formamidase